MEGEQATQTVTPGGDAPTQTQTVAAEQTQTVTGPATATGTVHGVASKTEEKEKEKPEEKCKVVDTDMTEDLQKEIIDLANEAWEKFPIKKFVYKPDEEDAIAPELGASFEISTQTALEQTSNHLAHIAQYIKTEIDKKHCPCWHVIVGDDFGCFMTHDSGTYIYLDMGLHRPYVLMFKSGTLDQPLY